MSRNFTFPQWLDLPATATYMLNQSVPSRRRLPLRKEEEQAEWCEEDMAEMGTVLKGQVSKKRKSMADYGLKTAQNTGDADQCT